MCACVKHHYRIFWSIAQILHEPGKVQPLFLFVPVAVLVQACESSIPFKKICITLCNLQISAVPELKINNIGNIFSERNV
jgi:hypothetical protein